VPPPGGYDPSAQPVPPGGYAPAGPGYQPVPAAPPAKRNNVKIILIVVAAIVALCCIGAAIGGFFIFRGVNDALAPPRDAAAGYAQDIKDSDYAGAYDRLCDNVKSQLTEGEFARAIADEFPIDDFEVTGTNVETVNGVSNATVTMRITPPSGEEFTHTFPLVKEDGDWRICQ
jgi:hypothetical protein